MITPLMFHPPDIQSIASFRLQAVSSPSFRLRERLVLGGLGANHYARLCFAGRAAGWAIYWV